MLFLRDTLHGETFEISGNVRYTVLPDSTTPRSTQLQFQVKLFNTGWQIRTTDPSNTRGANTYVFNGEKLLFEKDWTGIVATNTYGIPRQMNTATNSLRIDKRYDVYPPDAVPCFDLDLAFPIWLAFLSDRYFDARSTTDIPDFTSMGQGVMLPGDPKLSSRIERRSWGESWLPKEIDFYSLGFHAKREVREHPTLQRWRAPFDKGFLCAKYRTSEWRNVNGRDYPAAATLEIIGPRPGAAAVTDVRVVTRTTITTEGSNHHVEKEIAITLPIPQSNQTPVVVKDYTITTRFGAPISYQTKTGLLNTSNPNLSNVLLANTGREEAKRRQTRESGNSLPRPVVWAILGTLTLAPVVAFGYRKVKSKTSKKKIG